MFFIDSYKKRVEKFFYTIPNSLLIFIVNLRLNLKMVAYTIEVLSIISLMFYKYKKFM